MNRYIAVVILGLALLFGNIWHNTVRAQRVTRFVEGVYITGAASPYLRLVDTDNTVTLYVQAQDTIGVVGTSSTHDLHFTTDDNVEMTILANGDVGIGTTNPAGPFHLVAASPKFFFGNVETDNAIKYAWLAVEHYDTDEEPFFFTTPYVGDGVNHMRIGGGSNSGNASTKISFYTAANSTTLSGTEVGQFASNGYFYFTDAIVDLGDTNTFLSSNGSDTWSISTGGGIRTTWTNTWMTQSVPIDVGSQYLKFTERADPGDPGANTVTQFVTEIGGVTNWCLHFPGGSSIYCMPDPIP